MRCYRLFSLCIKNSCRNCEKKTVLAALWNTQVKKYSLTSYGGDLFGTFLQNSIDRSAGEHTPKDFAHNYIPEKIEDSTEQTLSRDKTLENVNSIENVLDRLRNGEDPKTLWGTFRNFLIFVGIEANCLHEKALMRYMKIFHDSYSSSDSTIGDLGKKLLPLVDILRNHPLALAHGAKSPHFIDLTEHLVKILSAIAVAAYEERLPDEARKIFDYTRSKSNSSMQKSGILCLQASVLNRQSMFSEALSCANKSIEKSQGANSMAYYHAAYALIRLGNTACAYSVIERGLLVITDDRREKLIALKDSISRK